MEFWLLYLAVMLALPVIRGRIIDPDLLRERHTAAHRERDPFAAILLFSHWGLAALDLLMGWSAIPMGARIIATICFLAGSALNTWSMRINRFFSSVVRIQHDRGHHVVQRGPYGVIRHPGNLGGCLSYAASGIMLGSWLAAIVGLIGIVKMVLRIAREDRMLHAELPGYPAYADRVRWRLVPGIW